MQNLIDQSHDNPAIKQTQLKQLKTRLIDLRLEEKYKRGEQLHTDFQFNMQEEKEAQKGVPNFEVMVEIMDNFYDVSKASHIACYKLQTLIKK